MLRMLLASLCAAVFFVTAGVAVFLAFATSLREGGVLLAAGLVCLLGLAALLQVDEGCVAPAEWDA